MNSPYFWLEPIKAQRYSPDLNLFSFIDFESFRNA